MLKKWDGRYERFQYPKEDIDTWGLMIDDSDGTIYYKSRGGLAIWCPASRLRSHMVRLYQLGIAQMIPTKKAAPTLARENG
jgi:hypothetical protein